MYVYFYLIFEIVVYLVSVEMYRSAVISSCGDRPEEQCTFELSLGNRILITQGSVMEETPLSNSNIPTAVKG